MKNKNQSVILKTMKSVGVVFAFFVLLFVYSKWGPAIPFSTTTQLKGDPLIVSETGKVSVVPDIAKIVLGIDESGNNLKKVQDDLNKKSKALIVELKKLGVEEKNIKTISYNVYPEYSYDRVPNKVVSYRVSTSYEVKITNFEKINDVIVTATQNGVNTIGNISFDVNQETKEKKLQEAREEAVRLAKIKAQGLVKAAGIRLGKIINVSESEKSDYPIPVMYTKDASEIGRETANVTPGETDIEVVVSLSYEVK